MLLLLLCVCIQGVLFFDEFNLFLGRLGKRSVAALFMFYYFLRIVLCPLFFCSKSFYVNPFSALFLVFYQPLIFIIICFFHVSKFYFGKMAVHSCTVKMQLLLARDHPVVASNFLRKIAGLIIYRVFF